MQRRVAVDGDGKLTVIVEIREEVTVVYDCGSDEDATEDESTELVSSIISSDSEDSSIIYSSSDENAAAHRIYPNTMTLDELNAGKARLEKFNNKCDNREQVSLVEQHRVHDTIARLNDFELQAARGKAEFLIPEGMPSTRKMPALAFNRGTPKFKDLFVQATLGSVTAYADGNLLFRCIDGLMDAENIHKNVIAHLRDLGDTIAAKNNERYEANARLPAYSTVIQKRRAEVEAMLDAGNQKEYRAALNV